MLCVIVTIAQLSGTEGNLLASALVSAYAVFLAFSAVSQEYCLDMLAQYLMHGVMHGYLPQLTQYDRAGHNPSSLS